MADACPYEVYRNHVVGRTVCARRYRVRFRRGTGEFVYPAGRATNGRPYEVYRDHIVGAHRVRPWFIALLSAGGCILSNAAAPYLSCTVSPNKFT